MRHFEYIVQVVDEEITAVLQHDSQLVAVTASYIVISGNPPRIEVYSKSCIVKSVVEPAPWVDNEVGGQHCVKATFTDGSEISVCAGIVFDLLNPRLIEIMKHLSPARSA